MFGSLCFGKHYHHQHQHTHTQTHWRNGFNRTNKPVEFRLDKYGNDFAAGYTVTSHFEYRNELAKMSEEKKREKKIKNERTTSCTKRMVVALFRHFMDRLSYTRLFFLLSLTLYGLRPFAPLCCRASEAEMRDVCCQRRCFFVFFFSLQNAKIFCEKIKRGPELKGKWEK